MSSVYHTFMKLWNTTSALTILQIGTGKRCISLSCKLSKRTPHTVGIMSWVRAGRRRKYLEQKMRETTQQEYQVFKEEKILRMEPEIEFRTTSRTHDEINENVMSKHLTVPEVFLSKDQRTIICHHPPSNTHPIYYTKPAVGVRNIGIPDTLAQTFKDSMSSNEVKEASQLRSADPRVWNTNALSLLFQVQPSILKKMMPTTDQQLEIEMAEKEVFKGMSVGKRKRYTELQQWERLKYIRATRDNNFAQWYASALKSRKTKLPIPPKF